MTAQDKCFGVPLWMKNGSLEAACTGHYLHNRSVCMSEFHLRLQGSPHPGIGVEDCRKSGCDTWLHPRNLKSIQTTHSRQTTVRLLQKRTFSLQREQNSSEFSF